MANRVTSQTTIDPIKMFRATNAAPDGQIYEYMNRARVSVADHLQRNAPRNSPLNEKHRSRGNPTYANGFVTDMYGNQSGSGFRVGNQVAHARVVEFGKRRVFRPLRIADSGEIEGGQRFSWTKWGGQIRRVENVKAREPTFYMTKGTERAMRRFVSG